MMKECKNMQKETKGNKLWCTECKTEGHTKGSCPKNQFCDIYQIMRHSTKECPFNMKTKGHQQVLLTQKASASSGSGNNNNDGATSDGYRNNRRGLQKDFIRESHWRCIMDVIKSRLTGASRALDIALSQIAFMNGIMNGIVYD